MISRIHIEPLNQYEFLFPNKKLVDRDTLRLIKYLKQEGHEVIVLPDDGKPIDYFFQKGIKELFSDPVFVQVFPIISGAVGALLANMIQKVIDNSQTRNSSADKNVIIDIENNFYNFKGDKLLKGEINDKKKKQKSLQDDFKKQINTKSPYRFLPTPILIEHKPKIIGWCEVESNSKGLKIIDSRILDKNVFRKIEKGKIKGASLTGIATKTECSICKCSYVDCVHVSGDCKGAGSLTVCI